MASGKSGRICRVAGPVVTAEGVSPRMYDVVLVGELKLMGEVIKLVGDKTVIQVYEDTSGIRPGEVVVDTGAPLQVELGPGLLSSVYDGVQRPLPVLMEKQGDFVSRGVTAPGLNRSKKWKFKPTVKKGDDLHGGMIVGEVPEGNIVHKVLLPPGVEGKVTSISEGEFTVEEPVGTLDTGHAIKLAQYWPVRSPRPYMDKLLPDIPLVTGQRVLDMLFPLAKGGTAAIPGGFGTGKTVTSQQLSKWSDAQIVVYVGCGERGNEMTEVLTTFPELEDPKSGKPLMGRTVLIANTSNMPVAAREASVYTGITIA
ncbi:MAG TPA: V-type ATP synthase subunit A, partial [Thermoplasmata archaeon]|nr:V-type ATP synthase subunit A [Thermoplasmata archaeon]